MLSPGLRKICLLFFCVASLEFLHVYVEMVPLWINLPAYLAGTERLPFQTRILPAFFLWPVLHWHVILHWATGHGWIAGGTFSKAAGLDACLLWNILAFAAACIFTLKLYRAVSAHGHLGGLVLITLLTTCIWSYLVHTYQNIAFPYDLPSLAFLTAGIFYIFERRFLPLAIVMFFGTLNRETTLFLVPIFLIDAIQSTPYNTHKSFALRLRRLPWIKTLALCAIWTGVRLTVGHIFAHNDASETAPRLMTNLRDLAHPKYLPAMLNLCAYLMPVVWIARKQIRPARFGAYANVFPLWIIVMAYKAILLETRVHGEWAGYISVTAVLLLERYLEDHRVERRPAAKPDCVPDPEVVGLVGRV